MDNDGKTISNSNDRIRNNRVCRELTIKYGLYMPKGKENVKYDRLRGKDKHKYENEVISHTGNSIINAVADLLLQPNAVISSGGGGGNSNQLDDVERKRENRKHIRSKRR